MEVSYTYFAFSAVFNAFVSTFLGFLILFKDRKNKIYRNLAWFSFGVALWSYAYILWPLAPNRELTLLSFQLLHIPACFVSIFYLHFVVNWLGIYKKQRLIIWLGYIISFFFACTTFTTDFIAGMVPKFGMRYWAVPGPLYDYYLVMFFGFTLYATYLLIRHYSKETEIKKKQIALMLVGIVLSFIGGSTNYYLWYEVNIPPYGNILASSFVIFTVYAIIRYKLLNIKLIATEGALLIMNTLLLFRFLTSRDTTELIVNLLIMIGSLVLSFILISSVKKEIKRREEVTVLARSLEAANAQLKELDQQKTEFLSIASHQLRTPLSIAKGYIELIKDGAYGKAGPEMVKVLDKMDTSNEHLVKLVDEFLDITHIEQGQIKYDFAEKNICEITDDVIHELAEKATQQGLKISWACPRERKNIFCDGEKIRHVVLNFIDNAIKYSDKGVVAITLKNENKGVAFRVKDNGLGFDKADEAGFFQKFYRGNNVKGVSINGTGLGLFVCRKFIEAHKGKVWAHSDGLGKGSEFGFWIPSTQNS
ncbi:MAG: ATP-binding protein [Patescibacteria group bacterium]